MNLTDLNITELAFDNLLYGDKQYEFDSLSTDIKSILNALTIIWYIISGILIFFMQTGFSFLEAGSVRYEQH